MTVLEAVGDTDGLIGRVACNSSSPLGRVGTFADTFNVPADQPTIMAVISATFTGDVITIAAGYGHSEPCDDSSPVRRRP